MHPSVSDLAATIKIVAKKTDENPTGYVVINSADFDEKTHKEYTGPDYVPPAAEEAAE
jgi:hypothetical protein